MDDRGEVLCRWAGAAIADDDIAMVEGVVAPNTIGSASAEESPTASKANLSKACCGHPHCTYDGPASEAALARASIPSRAPAIVANGGSGRADALTYDTMPLPLWVDTVEKVEN